MATAHAERHIAADPVSTALLLTSPDALLLWPGMELGERPAAARTAGASTVRTTDVPAVISTGRRRDDVVIAAVPPRRTPTSFVAGFRVVGGSFGTTDGSLTLSYAAGGTLAAVVLDSPRDDLEAPARRFLAELARRAEQRCSAA